MSKNRLLPLALLIICLSLYGNTKGRRFKVDKVTISPYLLRTENSQKALHRKFGKIKDHSPHSKQFIILKKPRFEVEQIGLTNRKKIWKENFLPYMSSFLKPGKNFQDNSLITAIHFAHAQHRPLILSPDTIWLTLLQGFVIHLHQNKALLQKYLGNKQKTLRVYMYGWSKKGSLDKNPWVGAIKKLTEKIVKRTPAEINKLLLAKFSTTGTTEAIAYKINLLNAYRNNYKYEIYAVCGIPWIKLEGNSKDWQNIVKRVEGFRKFGLNKWVDRLKPILTQFVKASQGKIDKLFWQNIYKNPGAYTQILCNGWILKLFPYLVQYEKKETPPKKPGKIKYIKNPFVEKDPKPSGESYPIELIDGIALHHFPNGLAIVPFLFIDLQKRRFAMQAISGFMGVSQNRKTKALKPEIGWVIKKK